MYFIVLYCICLGARIANQYKIWPKSLTWPSKVDSSLEVTYFVTLHNDVHKTLVYENLQA